MPTRLVWRVLTLVTCVLSAVWNLAIAKIKYSDFFIFPTFAHLYHLLSDECPELNSQCIAYIVFFS